MSLLDLSAEELRQLRAALAAAEITVPLSSKSFGAANLGRLIADVDVLFGLDELKAIAILDLLLESRARSSPPPELVWTGPESPTAAARDTEVVVRRLFASARRDVIAAGYSFYRGADILRPLHEAMRDHGVRTLMFVDIPRPARVPAEIERHSNDHIRGLLASIWPFGEPRPDVYYDPRTATPGVHASLHAKCVVVDDEVALLGSANFTDRAQTRNIEAGVLLRDAAFARGLAEHWRELVRGRHVARYSA